MTEGPDYHKRRGVICSKIRSLLTSLTGEPPKYDQIVPKIEYWIEFALRERFATVDELVEGVSGAAWEEGGFHKNVGRFFREFYDASHRSEQARSFVAQLCPYVLRWFAIASAEDLWLDSDSGDLSFRGGPAFIRAASFVGSLIEWGMLSRELVRQYLVKPLINHNNNHGHKYSPEAVRANAIYQLFTAAGNSLLQGLLETEDVQACFEIFDSRRGWINGFNSAKLQVRYASHDDASYN